MSTHKARRKNSRAVSRLPSIPSSSPTALNSLLDCYNFLAPNEYSEKTFGILAFVLRKSVGTINFADIIDEAEKRNQQGLSADFITLLEERRKTLPEIDASIEKCLMINRLISYIQENETRFSSIHSHIRLEMKINTMDKQLNQDIQYPEDFRRREADFVKRKTAQDMRRLFYFSHSETKEPSNLIQLQNRTTEHLSYLIDHKMRYEPTFRDTGLKELEKIFANSFMIISHPHTGVNPVLIYERKGPGIYTAKGSVTIVSLLYDFMQTHPNTIELYDIEPTLCPASDLYKRDESQKLSWKTCHFQACLGNKPQIIQYAELSSITIQQTYKNDTRVHFAQALHTLKFNIKFHDNLTEYRFSKTYQITLESLPFGISPYNSQIPQLLTRVILDDIKRFSKLQSTDIKIILYFMLRYFMHRTGVKPTEDHKIYLEEELKKAMNASNNFQTLEDIYMDFLVPYVYQVEFMAKHPILAMFYADGLFLGICNSARAAEVMKKSSDENLPKVGLRFNSIKVDYNVTSEISALITTIKVDPCAIRVDMYNNRTKTIRYRTFDSSMLSSDISKFVSKALSDNLSHIRILCNFDDKTNDKTYKSFAEFSKYHHTRLHELSKNEEKYKLITDLGRYIDDDDSEDSLFDDDDGSQTTDSSDQHSFISDLIPSASAATSNEEHSSETTHVDDYRMSMFNDCFNINEASSQHILSPFEQQQQLQFLNNREIIQYIVDQPELVTQLLRQFNESNLTSQAVTTQQQQFYESQTLKIETCDKATSVPEIEDFSIQTEKKLSVMATSTEYSESSPSSSHSIRPSKTPTNSPVIETIPTCCADFISLTPTTTPEYGNYQHAAICPTELKQNDGILIVYLGEDASSLIGSNNTIPQNIKIFKDEWSCMSDLLSNEEQTIYFIISDTLATIIIPLIHNHICIEQIYIEQNGSIAQNFAWIDAYSKIRGTWSSIQKIVEQVKRDVSSIEARHNPWSRTSDIFGRLSTKKSSTTIVPVIADDIKQIYEVPIIVTLCGIRPTPFDLSKDRIKTYEFSTVEDCHQFIKEQGTSPIFLIILGDYNNVIVDEVQPLIEHNSIHAVYIYPINNKQYEVISACKNSKISGIFYQEKDLLLQLVADIYFFQQIPTHISKLSMLEIEFDILSTLNENKKAFLTFQSFIDVLNQLWCSPGVPSKISDLLKIADTDLLSDLYMNNIQLTLEIDGLIKRFDSDTLIKASSRLHLINQYFESSIQKTFPFSITIYRVQLVSDEDLEEIQKNKNSLFAIHTFVLASQSYSSTRNICRRAVDDDLTAILLEINIPKKTPLTYVDSDVIIFPLSTVFKIKSTAVAPDKICHVQMELADSTIDLIKEQVYYTIGKHLTWLTFGNYLAHIEEFDAAEKYFQYLLDIIPPDSQEYASIYNNMGLTYLLMNGKDQEAFDCLQTAKNLMNTKAAKVSEIRTEHTEKHSKLDDEAGQYEKLAELHEQNGDHTYACLFYEKVLQSTTDPALRKLYQLKIETLNIKT